MASAGELCGKSEYAESHHHLKDMRCLQVALLRDSLMELLICQSYHR